MDVRDIQRHVHQWAIEKGWTDGFTSAQIPEKLMLMCCEVAEAMEEYRVRSPNYYVKDGKPEGIGVELADVVIRILQLASMMDIDMNAMILEKMEYNRTRPFRHGNKLA